MNLTSIIIRNYEENRRFGLEKNKANSKPISGLWPEIRQLRLCSRTSVAPCRSGNKMNECGMTALKAQFTEHDLKKQSQFAGGLNYVKLVITTAYEDFMGPRRRKNKPNSKPIKANLASAQRFRAEAEQQWTTKRIDDGHSSIVPHPSSFQPLRPWGIRSWFGGNANNN